MPFSRPSLQDLIDQAAADVEANLPGADALLRFSVLGAITKAQAGLAWEQYGYLDYIAQQAIPVTAEGEALESWGALKAVFRKAATSATGQVIFTGADGTVLASGQSVAAGDGTQFTTLTGGTVAAGTVTVNAQANVAASAGNVAAGTTLSLTNSIAGITAGGVAAADFSGGADQEDDDSFRARVMAAFQSQPAGGSRTDYVGWAMQVAGVTRAWCMPSGFGTGTVVIYTMFDNVRSSAGGFPQGTDGIATAETRSGTKATGDQLLVANALNPLQPVTALVYSCAPIPDLQSFTIAGIANSNTATRAAIAAAIRDVFVRTGSPGGTVYRSDYESAIAAVPNTAGFLVTAPTGNIVSATGYLPSLATIVFV